MYMTANATDKQTTFITSLSQQIGWGAAAKVAVDTIGWDPVIESSRTLTAYEASRLIDALKKVRYQ